MSTAPQTREELLAMFGYPHTHLGMMVALLLEWEPEIRRYPNGLIELAYSETQVKIGLRVHLGVKKVVRPPP